MSAKNFRNSSNRLANETINRFRLAKIRHRNSVWAGRQLSIFAAVRGDRWGGDGGRLYVTCLSLYTLEVYYRHLPLYQTGITGGGY